jgi:cardiolipin synthase
VVLATYLTILGAIFLLWFVLVVILTPGIDYHVRLRVDTDDPAFLPLIKASCQAAVHDGNRVQILTNGSVFYPEMLDAIRSASRSVNVECYIFEPGGVGDDFVEALAGRARAGVRVNVVVDSIGSSRLASGGALATLRDAGCHAELYQPVTWYRLHRLNNRTHRELFIIDGRTAFVGGAGIADWWAPESGDPGWRDTMARVEGPVVAALQGVFAENWLECCGEILTGPDQFPDLEPAGETTALVVKSSPSDRATASRVVFQLLVEGARHDVRISTPYFLPDRAFRRCLIAARARGVAVTVIVPGPTTDQRWVRFASRRLYGELLAAGVQIYEYDPVMTHVKALVVDEIWSVIGTTNFDNRSFEHNDEVNLATRDAALTSRLAADFEIDRLHSRLVTLSDWEQRSLPERIIGPFAWVLERQQ